ncbi:MAG: TonB-dependent receptor, partial [Tannerella sp.]|nr:TonB-dependent receptor [Tannerella sp.]
MKVSTILMMFVLLQLGAVEVYSQKANVTINAERAKLSDVLDEMERQTDYLFFYNKKNINADKQVSVDVTNTPVSEVLDSALDEDVSYMMVNDHIILSKKEDLSSQKEEVMAFITQQGRKVSGIVSDVKGEPLIGASVVIKGTTNGIISDVDGRFSLNVPDNAVLEVSYVGYFTQEITVGNQTNLTITLEEDVEALEEVVVIGYGTAKKKDLTGSVVRADLSKLQESSNVSLASSLQGTVPGLNVGAVTTAGSDPEVTIRGRTSISGSNSPLIVLDGIIYRGSMVDLNPNDIESIDILKDASAAAIYGSQASNGVMLITSKSVKAMSKPIIEYTGSVSFQEASTNKMKPRNREEMLQLIADTYMTESRTGADMLSPNPDWKVTDHLMDANAVNGYIDGTETNWWDMVTNKTPHIQSHNLSVRGRSELSNYFMSIGLTDQENLIINDTYKRYNIRMNLDTKITNWLRVGAQTFFTLSDYSGVSPSFGNAIGLLPFVSPTDPETGEYKIYPYMGNLNPMLEMTQEDVDKRYNLFGNFYVDLDIPYIKGLNYRLNFSQNLIMDKDFRFNPYGSNLTGSGNKSNASQYSWTADHILTYKKTFGKHDINSTLVYGVEKRQYETANASGSDFANDVLGYNYLGAANATRQVISSSAWEESSIYALARLAYTFNGRYNFTGSVRRDGFSGFGKENKFAVFPSAAAAWRISEEDFLKDNVSWIDNLKLRLSYGANGNRTVSRYQTLAQMASGNAYLYGDGAPSEKGVWISSMANNGLKWETTNTFNIGLDFSVLNGRLFGSLEYYRSNTYDLLYNINIPYLNMDIASIPTNIGKLANRGQELNITGIPVQTKDFSWELTFNYSLNRNKVVSILGIDNDGDGKEDDLVSSKIFIGHPYGVAYDFETIGMWQLADYHAGNIPSGFTYGTYKIRDIDGDGNITAANDRKILGYTDPSYRFSIQNVLRYRDWELKIFVNSIQGGKDYYYGQPAYSIPIPDNTYKNNRYKWDYWTPENPNARYRQPGQDTQSIREGDRPYSPYFQRSFVRLQNLTLSYKVPSAFLKKVGVNNFKVYVTGDNLITITDWYGWDPETGVGLSLWSYTLMR